MIVHMEFRVNFPEFFQFSGRFSKAFYMLVIETHKTRFTTVLPSDATTKTNPSKVCKRKSVRVRSDGCTLELNLIIVLSLEGKNV